MKKYLALLIVGLSLSAQALPSPCLYDESNNNNLWLQSPSYMTATNYNPYLYTDINYPFLNDATPSLMAQARCWSYFRDRHRFRPPTHQTVPDSGATLPLLGAGLFGLFLIHRVTQIPAR